MKSPLPLSHSQHRILKLFQSQIDSSLPFQKELYQSLEQSVQCSQRILLASTMILFFDKDSDDFWKIVTAVECLSTASQLHHHARIAVALRHHHQDIVWENSGEAQILSGDYLLTLVLKIVNQIQKWDLIELIADTTTSVALGQGQELNHDTQKSHLKMIQNRFASLFATITKGASLTLGGDKSKSEALFEYGLLFGTIISLRESSLLEKYQNDLLQQADQLLDHIKNLFHHSPRVDHLSHLVQKALIS